MITVRIHTTHLDRVRRSLSTFSSRLTVRVFEELSALLHRQLGSTLAFHFLCCRPLCAKPVPRILTIRTGNLYNSVIKSMRISAHQGTLVVSIGSNLPYAAIHEYGGYAGRGSHRVYIPPRPYLKPTLDDLERMMPALLDLAIQSLDPTRLVSESQ